MKISGAQFSVNNAQQSNFSNSNNSAHFAGLRILPRTSIPNKEQAILVDSDMNPSATPSLKPFTCKLCQSSFADAAKLASHPCSRIQNVRYSCPECGKSFNCPANLASHRRWHKPKGKPLDMKQADSHPAQINKHESTASPKQTKSAVGLNADVEMKTCKRSHFSCGDCEKTFRRKSYLLQHAATKHFKNSAGVVGPRPPPPPYDFHQKKRNDQIVSTSQNRFEGLAALAYAAEVHSRLSTKSEYVNEPFVRNSSRKRMAQHCNGATPSKRFDESPNSTMWLPPSPPRSDKSASPISIVSDDARSTKSCDLDACGSPHCHENITNAAYSPNAFLSPISKHLNHRDSVSVIGRRPTGLKFADSSSIMCNAAAQNLAWTLLKRPPIWNPMFL